MPWHSVREQTHSERLPLLAQMLELHYSQGTVALPPRHLNIYEQEKRELLHYRPLVHKLKSYRYVLDLGCRSPLRGAPRPRLFCSPLIPFLVCEYI